MLNNNSIQKIKNFLDLEKITVLQKISIVCTPKKNDDEFTKKFFQIKDELKKIDPHIELKISEDTEIVVKNLIEYKESNNE